MLDLRDQIAVITGASSGIGKAIAIRLMNEGATVCLVGRSSKTLDSVGVIAGVAVARVLKYRADLAMDEDIRALTKDLRQRFEGIDILVHSAGVISLGKVDQAQVENLDWQYRINLRAPYLLTQRLLPMLRLRRGQVVFMNSTAGLNARANLSQYSATKHALRAIADSLRNEVKDDGLRVLSVYPGRTATPMQATVLESEGREYKPERLMHPDDVAELVLSAIRLSRTSEVTDIILRPSFKLQKNRSDGRLFL